MYSVLPEPMKNSQDPRRNDTIRKVDAECPHDLGNVQQE